ncbi:hypothetical protein AaE_003822 [Aphanomyces astaci]|uniref:Reverse transcriptase Ty1/copia-type domain-containing protein n=1 Tax=Aphanomyces astaci TaxID=112090 RepID=A0A6A5A6B2_APHAT|nr:hypothetical protein AaE_003822 [Aphanomyces astaci]
MHHACTAKLHATFELCSYFGLPWSWDLVALTWPMEPLFIYALLADCANNNDPKDWRDAMSLPDRDKWLLAAKSEHQSLLSKGTYVFRLKADGTYKARLVIKGFMQQKDIDYIVPSSLLRPPRLSDEVFIVMALKILQFST